MTYVIYKMASPCNNVQYTCTVRTVSSGEFSDKSINIRQSYQQIKYIDKSKTYWLVFSFIVSLMMQCYGFKQ